MKNFVNILLVPTNNTSTSTSTITNTAATIAATLKPRYQANMHKETDTAMELTS